MNPILTISRCSDIKSSEKCPKYMYISFEPYEDSEGILNMPEDICVFGDVCDKIVVGKKIRR